MTDVLEAIKGELASVQSQLNQQQITNKEQTKEIQTLRRELTKVSEKQNQKIDNLKHIVTSGPTLQCKLLFMKCMTTLSGHFLFILCL